MGMRQRITEMQLARESLACTPGKEGQQKNHRIQVKTGTRKAIKIAR